MKRNTFTLLQMVVCISLTAFQSLQGQFVQIYSGKINGLEWINAYYGSANELAVAFGDLDADGDLDLVQGSRFRLEWLENIGTPQVTRLDALNWGNIVPDKNVFWTPALVDIDNDHDLDIVCGQLIDGLALVENVGSATSPAWSEPIYQWQGITTGSHSHPALCDIDHDGDPDLFVGNSTGKLYYYKNTGTATVAAFTLQTDSYVETGTTSRVAPFFCDIDRDGDFDLLLSTNGQISWFKNTGTRETAAWTLETHEFANIHSAGNNAISASMVDIDADSDLDLFYTDQNGFFFYYNNTGTTAAPVWTYLLGNANLSLNIGQRSTPALGDVDADGDLDVLIGVNYDIYVLENVSAAGVLAWKWLGIKAVELGSSWLTPELVDIDADGDLDLFVGSIDGRLYYYQNTGTRFAANLVQITSNYNGVTYGANSHVSVEFADIDNDGDQDMFVQHFKSSLGDSLVFFENAGTANVPVWDRVDDNYMDISTNGVSFGTCDFADLDGDGDLDALFGTSEGGFVRFENRGTPEIPSWTFSSSDTMAVENNTRYSTPAVGDINGDSRPDIVSGLDGGGLNIWLNTGETGLMHPEGKKQPTNPGLLNNYPNPFNATTRIVFRLPRAAFVRLDIVDISGRLVETLVESRMEPGEHQMQWHAAAVSSGVYFCRLLVGDWSEVSKMVLIK